MRFTSGRDVESFKTTNGRSMVNTNKMAYHDIAHMDSRRFMTRPPRAYRQLGQMEKGMVEQWCTRSGKAFVHKHGFLLYFDMPIQYIALIFVERAHRGRGIGSLLLSKCATPCMATILDKRIWQNHGWELHTIVPGFVTVAVHGLSIRNIENCLMVRPLVCGCTTNFLFESRPE